LLLPGPSEPAGNREDQEMAVSPAGTVRASITVTSRNRRLVPGRRSLGAPGDSVIVLRTLCGKSV